MGDIPGGKSVQVTYNIKIPKQAAAGEYLLPLTISYQYLAGAEAECRRPDRIPPIKQKRWS